MNVDLGILSQMTEDLGNINLGDGAQEISSIALDDVLNITDTDNLLRIDGDSNDSLNLNTQGDDAQWSLGEFKTDTETGANYQEYTATDGDNTVTLEISTDVEVQES
jgi:hypothetical protein